MTFARRFVPLALLGVALAAATLPAAHAQTVPPKKLTGAIRYSVWADKEGWSAWAADGAPIASAKGKAISAVKLELLGELAARFTLEVQGRRGKQGWTAAVGSGAVCGAETKEPYLDGLRVKLVPTAGSAGPPVDIVYGIGDGRRDPATVTNGADATLKDDGVSVAVYLQIAADGAPPVARQTLPLPGAVLRTPQDDFTLEVEATDPHGIASVEIGGRPAQRGEGNRWSRKVAYEYDPALKRNKDPFWQDGPVEVAVTVTDASGLVGTTKLTFTSALGTFERARIAGLPENQPPTIRIRQMSSTLDASRRPVLTVGLEVTHVHNTGPGAFTVRAFDRNFERGAGSNLHWGSEVAMRHLYTPQGPVEAIDLVARASIHQREWRVRLPVREYLFAHPHVWCLGTGYEQVSLTPEGRKKRMRIRLRCGVTNAAKNLAFEGTPLVEGPGVVFTDCSVPNPSAPTMVVGPWREVAVEVEEVLGERGFEKRFVFTWTDEAGVSAGAQISCEFPSAAQAN